MFEIKPAYSIGPNGDKKMAVDEARDVWLQRIGNVGHDQPGATIFKLVWGERVIPFEVQADPEPPDIASWKAASEYERQINVRFLYFGASQGASIQGKIPAYRFENDAEREAAQLLAVEAMLVFGDFYNGLECLDGFFRFHYGDKIYVSSDFGS